MQRDYRKEADRRWLENNMFHKGWLNLALWIAVLIVTAIGLYFNMAIYYRW